MKKIPYKIFIGLPRKIYYYSLKFYREIFLPKFPNLFRISSYPYITGDTFRKFSDHILDEGEKIKINKIKEGEIVFVQSDFIEEYFDNYNPNITVSHILVTHNNLQPITEKYIDKVSENIMCWFAQNLDIKSEIEKLKALPLGIENIRTYSNGVTSHFENKIVKSNMDIKQNLILSSFAPHTNIVIREKPAEVVKKISFIDISTYPDHKTYIQNLSTYKFNICPSGAGIDTHRFWESLIVKSIPVVKRNNLNTHFENHGIPMLVLNEWEDLLLFDEEKLNRTYDELSHLLTVDRYLSFDYWLDLIKSQK